MYPHPKREIATSPNLLEKQTLRFHRSRGFFMVKRLQQFPHLGIPCPHLETQCSLPWRRDKLFRRKSKDLQSIQGQAQSTNACSSKQKAFHSSFSETLHTCRHIAPYRCDLSSLPQCQRLNLPTKGAGPNPETNWKTIRGRLTGHQEIRRVFPLWNRSQGQPGGLFAGEVFQAVNRHIYS